MSRTGQKKLRKTGKYLFLFFLCFFSLCFTSAAASENLHSSLKNTVEYMASLGDRSVGSEGNREAAAYIRQRFEEAEPEALDSIYFSLPIVVDHGAKLVLGDKEIELQSLSYNAVTPQSLPRDGLAGPLIYAGKGELHEFNGMDVLGAVVLLDFHSGRNWLNAASLGAVAVIYISDGQPTKQLFQEKQELSPIQFPCFFIQQETALASFGPLNSQKGEQKARLFSSRQWQEVELENIYAFFPGTNPAKENKLLVVEAFYDASVYLSGHAPGADEALSIAGLLDLADRLQKNPPARPVMLIASDGHSQSQAGVRESIWALTSRSKDLRKQDKQLKTDRKTRKNYIRVLEEFTTDNLKAEETKLFQEAIGYSLKLEVDALSNDLMHLRMQENRASVQQQISELATRRMELRRIGWQTDLSTPGEKERTLLAPLIDNAIEEHELVLKELKKQRRHLLSAKRFRSFLVDFELHAFVSLHLSSHGSGIGAFERGYLYHPLRQRIDRTNGFRNIDQSLHDAAAHLPVTLPVFVSTLRPNRLQPWEDLLPDKPQLGGEAVALAGLPGFTLATTGDMRSHWATPDDTPQHVNWPYAQSQWQTVLLLLQGLDEAENLEPGYIRNGFATVGGRGGLLLHGELFAEHPAPDTVLLAFQGLTRFYVMTDRQGHFLLKGVADKKHVQDKVILEGYRFAHDGSIVWAIDKKQTGKDSYRVKMQRLAMQTDLTFFPCSQTTIFNLLEPRTLHYMTKLQLIDGRREAPPLRYWYSRIDTRSSIISSIFLEPEARLKLTLSDSVLSKKLILTNGDKEHPLGTGYSMRDTPSLYRTSYKAARDIWTLLAPRIDNLESHGIFDDKISELQREGTTALQKATQGLKDYRYDIFSEQAARSWALASRVYDHVEKTQKDILFGVLFYIALFVPFAFCAERLLFGFVNIYKRIGGFSAILMVLILLIAKVHPAFALAYSPTVVIIAFFIIGLSFLVTMIITVRFEDEMLLLQRRASHKRPVEISSWKAFMAAFFLGVSNLRRRRLRTALTCLTLIILTFTIMSFTSVKSVRRQNRLQFADTANYQGILIKDISWKSLPSESLSTFRSLFDSKVITSPRVWLGADEPTRAARFELRFQGQPYTFQGLTGLGAHEPELSGLDRILLRGKWFQEDDQNSVLIPSRLAARLDLDPDNPDRNILSLWGITFKIAGIFSEKLLQQYTDLDSEILTPVTFPSETSLEMSDVEQEALESGDDVRSFQGRYRHLDPGQILIIPARTLLELGGNLKAVALRPEQMTDSTELGEMLSDRFGLSLFSGEKNGVFLYNASDAMRYSGMPNILVPLLISVLIVLNTMISSVFERKREIAVYTSVGLAPSHVSFLFIAEAAAFGVLSVVLGYLLAQGSAGLLAGTALWKGITVNYSSMAGVAAMLLVMGVVLLSVIYPSRMASRIAIPDVNKSWRLPEAKNDTIHVSLPFLMRYHEQDSICGFLYSFLSGHQDVSHGLFSTGPVDVVPHSRAAKFAGVLPLASDCIHLRTKVWLAPFDFGIMQRVDIRFCKASEGEDFLEIYVSIERKAGEISLWRRINTSFLHALRKQLLVWRSLNEEGHTEYRSLLPRPEES